jgi:hypothetical protein
MDGLLKNERFLKNPNKNERSAFLPVYRSTGAVQPTRMLSFG